MSPAIVILVLGIFAIRALSFRSRSRWRHGPSPLLEEKVTRLEAQVADLQEQIEQDRIALARLEEERDFLTQLYPSPSNEARAVS